MKNLLKLTIRAFDRVFTVPPFLVFILYALIIIDSFHEYCINDSKIQLFCGIAITCCLIVSFIGSLFLESFNKDV